MENKSLHTFSFSLVLISDFIIMDFKGLKILIKEQELIENGHATEEIAERILKEMEK